MESLIKLITLIVTSLKDPSFASIFISLIALIVAAMAVHGMTKALKSKEK